MTKTCFAFVQIQATRSNKSAQDAVFNQAVKSTAFSPNYPPSSILRVMEKIGFLHNNEIKKTLYIF